LLVARIRLDRNHSHNLKFHMMFRLGAAASLVLAASSTQTTEDGLFDDACRSLEAQDGASCSMALLQLRMKKTSRKISQDQDFIVAAPLEDDPDHWSYSNTDLWESTFGSCGGVMQSPINVDTSKLDVADVAQSTSLNQFVKYSPVGSNAALKTKNTGHSVQVNGAFGSLSLPDGEYDAKQIQFHFPSEHTVDGTASAGEMHIIHQRRDATGTDGLAVVAILLRTALPGTLDSQQQKEVDFFASLGFGKRLPSQGTEIQLPENVIMDLEATFGSQLAGTFFHYQGSLTAPPCAEDVHWYIVKEPAFVNRAMVNNFKSLFPSPANSRPTQLLNNRRIVDSQIETSPDEYSLDHEASDELVLEVEAEHEELEGDTESRRRRRDRSSRAPRWSYQHTKSWGDDYPDCGGDAQSPVDIDTDDVVPGSDTGPKLAELAAYSMANSGLSVSNTGKGLTLQGAADGAFGVLRLPDGDYAVKQVDFHFPSEHTIDGIPAAGEMQIVHQKIGANDTDDMAVVSILLDEAQAAGQQELAFFGSLGFGSRLPVEDGSIPLNAGLAVNLGATFNAQLQGAFYHYVGSMTAPPCAETAHWYVMQTRAPATKAMINNFKSLFPDPANVRPVQKLNKRTVIESEVQVDDLEFSLEKFEESSKEKHWSYKHTANWKEDFPECGGLNQSPVDIDSKKAGDAVGTGAKLSELVRYAPVGPFAFLKTVNNGHSLQVDGDFGVLMLPDGDYTAKQLHFHFPSEHTIDGENAVGEMHIVHQRTDAEGTDGLAVIGVLLQVTERAGQPELSFFDSIGFGKGSLPTDGEELELPAGLQLNVGASFGAQLSQPYYHYRGSLTTPPCSETVHWYVLQTAAAVTQEMVDEFKDLFADPMNNRPVQELNGRKIGVSEIETDSEEFESAKSEKDWSYKKPEKWEKAYPSCAGTAQSPINIVAATASRGAVSTTLAETVTYETLGPYAWLKVFNTGHSIQLNGDFGILNLPDGEYEAKQLNFHFPSEHQIDGVQAVGEMHVVHQRKGASGTDGLAIIAVMLHDTDSLNPKVMNLFNSLGFSARLPTDGGELELPVGLTLNLGETFDAQLAGDFYHYEGSLTAPPCSGSVHWYVLQTPAGIAKSMVNNFKSLFPPPANNRPIQPVNGRAVVVSDLQTSPLEFGTPEPVQIEEKDTKSKKKKQHWSYSHSSDWEDDNEECGGENQSPINIDTLAASKYQGDSSLSDLVRYRQLGSKDNLQVTNNGHAVQLDGNFGVLRLPDGDYVAKQLHFHFPSEHSVDGVLAAGEMHIVHQLQGATGTDALAVIGILLHEAELLTKSDATEQALSFFEDLGFGTQLPVEGWELPLGNDFSVDLETTFAQQLSGNFFHYEGSLTTPPCSETVHWYMMERPAPVTQAMISNFKALFPDPMNNRPLQPTNGRKVVINDVRTGKKEFGTVLPVEGQDEPAWDWTYDDTELWEDSYPDCAGDSQSPIDIDTDAADGFKGNQPLADRIHYDPLGPNSGLQVLNNGHAIKIAGKFGSLDLPDGSYAVRQLHFHFPSEHSVDGVLAAGEMQIIHQRVGAQGTDGIAIVSVLLHDAEMLQAGGEGKELGFFSDLGFGAVLPQQKQLMDLPVETVVDIGDIFKSQFAGNYYHYGGSLTRPPCTESVHWYILDTPAPISRSMVNNFKVLFPSPMNNRPIQPLNDRDVWVDRIKTEKCEFGWCPSEEESSKKSSKKSSEKSSKESSKKSSKKDTDDDKDRKSSSSKKGTSDKGKADTKKSGKDADKSDKKKKEAEWHYSSVQKWEDDYSKCGGKKQSPIDVNTDKLQRVQGPGSALVSRMTYNGVGPNAGFEFKNNGHSLALDGNWGTLRLPDGDYIARSLHFHFPSEHAVDGVLAAGEMHIVHQRSDASGTDGLAVVAILLRDSGLLGQAGPVGFFDRLGFSSRLPVKDETILLGADTVLDIGAIFAPQLGGSYWHYEGSLTTPPCSETVHWYLMQTPAGINKAMVNNFKSLFPSPANNRPVQELNGRAVVDTELAVSSDEFP